MRKFEAAIAGYCKYALFNITIKGKSSCNGNLEKLNLVSLYNKKHTRTRDVFDIFTTVVVMFAKAYVRYCEDTYVCMYVDYIFG